jgi:hypothetical protein
VDRVDAARVDVAGLNAGLDADGVDAASLDTAGVADVFAD